MSLRGNIMAKRTARKISKSSRKASQTSFKAVKKQAKKGGGRQKERDENTAIRGTNWLTKWT